MPVVSGIIKAAEIIMASHWFCQSPKEMLAIVSVVATRAVAKFRDTGLGRASSHLIKSHMRTKAIAPPMAPSSNRI